MQVLCLDLEGVLAGLVAGLALARVLLALAEHVPRLPLALAEPLPRNRSFWPVLLVTCLVLLGGVVAAVATSIRSGVSRHSRSMWMSPTPPIRPSVKRKPTVSSRSWPGVRMSV